jgi:hypothetical protein
MAEPLVLDPSHLEAKIVIAKLIRSATVQIFCICEILEKKWECSETVHQVIIDLKKAYD